MIELTRNKLHDEPGIMRDEDGQWWAETSDDCYGPFATERDAHEALEMHSYHIFIEPDDSLTDF